MNSSFRRFSALLSSSFSALLSSPQLSSVLLSSPQLFSALLSSAWLFFALLSSAQLFLLSSSQLFSAPCVSSQFLSALECPYHGSSSPKLPLIIPFDRYGCGSKSWVPQQFHGFTLYKAAKNRELRRFYVLATSHVRAGYLPLLAGAGRMTLANLVHLVNWIVILRKRLSCLIMSLADV